MRRAATLHTAGVATRSRGIVRLATSKQYTRMPCAQVAWSGDGLQIELMTTVMRMAFVLLAACLGLVAGFCAGASLGSQSGGHGMAGLGDMFVGAALGLVLGLVVSLLRVRRIPEARIARANLVLVVVIAALVSGMYVAVTVFDAW